MVHLEAVLFKVLIFEKGDGRGESQRGAPIQGGVDTEINAIDQEGEDMFLLEKKIYC